MMRSRTAFTIVEALIVLAITALLVALITPVFFNAKQGAHIQSSISRMRQMWQGVEMYRRDYDGIDGAYDSFYALGLPTEYGFFSTLLGLRESFFYSPCGYDRVLFDSGINQRAGWITYTGPFFEPRILDLGANIAFRDYLATFREQTALFIDCYCNERGISLSSPLKPKRALAITISGQVINKFKKGDASLLQFYSDPPK